MMYVLVFLARATIFKQTTYLSIIVNRYLVMLLTGMLAVKCEPDYSVSGGCGGGCLKYLETFIGEIQV